MRKDQGNLNPAQDRTENKPNKSHVYLEPRIEVDIAQGLKDDIKTTNDQRAAHNKKQLVLTAVGAIAAIVAAALVGYQGCLLRESNKINRSSLESVQRAFVTFAGFRREQLIKRTPGGKEEMFLSISAVWENNGATPAMTVVRSFDIGELPDEPDGVVFRGALGQFSAGYIGPRAQFLVGPKDKEVSFFLGSTMATAPAQRYTLNSRKKIFAYGWLAYRDVFRQPHVTEFCQVYNRASLSSDAKLPDVALYFSNCSRHNCVDTDCEDYEAIANLLPK